MKLRHLEEWIEKRIGIADRYCERLESCSSIVLPKRAAWARQVYHLFVIRCPERDALRAHLTQQGIGSGIHYPCAIPKTPAYRHVGQAEESLLANSEDELLLSLPIGDHMNDSSVDFVCDSILSFFNS